MAGVTRLELAASGVTGRPFGVIWCKTVAFMPNAYHSFPPIPTQNPEPTLNSYALFLAANDLAAFLLPKPQAESALPNGVFSPSGFLSAPFMPPKRPAKDTRRGLVPDFIGRFKLPPSLRSWCRRPASLRPPPGARCALSVMLFSSFP